MGQRSAPRQWDFRLMVQKWRHLIGTSRALTLLFIFGYSSPEVSWFRDDNWRSSSSWLSLYYAQSKWETCFLWDHVQGLISLDQCGKLDVRRRVVTYFSIPTHSLVLVAQIGLSGQMKYPCCLGLFRLDYLWLNLPWLIRGRYSGIFPWISNQNRTRSQLIRSFTGCCFSQQCALLIILCLSS